MKKQNYLITTTVDTDGKTTTCNVFEPSNSSFYLGEAKCSDTDGFDANVGIKIAKERALINRAKDMYKIQMQKVDGLQKQIAKLNAILNHEIKVAGKFASEADGRENFLESYLNEH